MPSISEQCNEVARGGLNLYNAAHFLYDTLSKGEAPAEFYFKDVEDLIALYYTGAKAFLTEKDFHDLRVRLQDVRGHLPPAHEVMRWRPALRYSRLEHSLHDADRLVDAIANIMFDKVVDCECKRK